jgi:hypothetical protein
MIAFIVLIHEERAIIEKFLVGIRHYSIIII